MGGETEQAKAIIDKALRLLYKELEGSPDPLLVFVPREELMVFRGNLERMAAMIDAGELPPRDRRGFGMADAILDEWPFTFLGEAIVNAERAFRDA